MRSIFFRRLAVVTLITMILTSCTAKIGVDLDKETDPADQETNSSVEALQPEEDKKAETVPENIPEVKPEIAVQPETNNNIEKNADTKEEDNKPADKPVEKKIIGEFGKFDNTKYGWWYRRNKDKPPTIDNKYDQLLKKYDGIFRHDTDEKVLYLTFDEGYENGYTPKILDVLKENQTTAAFFITGPYLKKHSDLVKRMVEEGHIVANHTINHPSMPEILDDKKLEEEILGLERPFYEMFQQHMKYLRPPKGEYSERTLALTQSLGYKTVFWSFHYLDYDVKNQKGADHAYNEVMGRLHNGAVLLLHAVSKDNAEALDRIIKDAKAQGYEFKSLDEIE
ncbi:delta-lactam-biosynthetic de-N-acetylase [Petroclostridium sp. X23]|uniref:delta-lactam-biosynthetic de-N-acetylase n=1 Tax=Petroclostridium sp. X23 TaxID=3045146 RepID=UPI0024AD7E51|nr:delta-lactam-biosynthetic de-N-acetylase [Petroclostridium sp. X23]WHH59925.1 delta-lactam-biosynthetic de-N-acetylase [Petroclostridium sp. X23]